MERHSYANSARLCAALVACALLQCESDVTYVGAGAERDPEAGSGTGGHGRGGMSTGSGGASHGGQGTEAGGSGPAGAAGAAGADAASSGGAASSPDASVADSGAPSPGGSSSSGGSSGSGGSSSNGGTDATGGQTTSMDASLDSSAGAEAGVPDAFADVNPFPHIACPSGLPQRRARFETTIGLMHIATPAPTARYVNASPPRVLVSHDGSRAFGSFTSEYRALHLSSGGEEVAIPFIRAFEWSGSRFEDLSVPPGNVIAEVNAIDCSGTTFVGSTRALIPSNRYIEGVDLSFYAQAYRWTVSSGFEILPSPEAEASGTLDYSANFVTADGLTLLGNSSDGILRWSGSARPEVISPPSDQFWSASADARASIGETQGVRAPWFSSDGGPKLSIVEGDAGLWWLSPVDYILATAVAPDAACVIGTAYHVSSAPFAFTWTPAGGMRLFGINDFSPSATSARCHVIVGKDLAPYPERDTDWVWDAAHQMRRLRNVLALYGVHVPDGWTIGAISGISDDARVLVGTMTEDSNHDHVEAFRATLPAGAFD